MYYQEAYLYLIFSIQLLRSLPDIVCAQKPSAIIPLSPLPSTRLLADQPFKIELSYVSTMQAFSSGTVIVKYFRGNEIWRLGSADVVVSK